MYINNQLDNSSSSWMTGSTRDSGDTIHVGWGPAAGCSKITVDEVQLFDRVLDQDEIAAAYNSAPDSMYDIWAASYGLVEGKLGDDDNDGHVNLLEYSFGGNPVNGFVDGSLPQFGYSGDDLVYVYAPRSDDPNLQYYLETTEDLVGEPGWANSGYTVLETHVTGGLFDFVTNLIPTTSEKKFVRLNIESIE